MLIRTFKDAEKHAADLGIILTANDRRRIAETQAAERTRLHGLIGETPAPDLATRFNAFYPRLLTFILSIGETVLTFSQTLIVSRRAVGSRASADCRASTCRAWHRPV
jgi:hypothetical protein